MLNINHSKWQWMVIIEERKSQQMYFIPDLVSSSLSAANREHWGDWGALLVRTTFTVPSVSIISLCWSQERRSNLHCDSLSEIVKNFITHLIQNILLNLAGDKDTGAVLCNVVISGDQVRPGCVIIICHLWWRRLWSGATMFTNNLISPGRSLCAMTGALAFK